VDLLIWDSWVSAGGNGGTWPTFIMPIYMGKMLRRVKGKMVHCTMFNFRIMAGYKNFKKMGLSNESQSVTLIFE
jgi:hypothetical protein